MGIFSRIFGPGVDYAQLVKNGAIILDVRTPGEYAGGHIKGSKNIPLQSLQQQLKNLPKDKAIITCCASGGRSGQATQYFKSLGVICENGGGWMEVNHQFNR